MDWIQEMEEKYGKLSDSEFLDALLDYIDYRVKTSNYEDMERATILNEINQD